MGLFCNTTSGQQAVANIAAAYDAIQAYNALTGKTPSVELSLLLSKAKLFVDTWSPGFFTGSLNVAFNTCDVIKESNDLLGSLGDAAEKIGMVRGAMPPKVDTPWGLTEWAIALGVGYVAFNLFMRHFGNEYPRDRLPAYAGGRRRD